MSVATTPSAATQTKLNVDYIFGSRGPGTNEGDYFLRPHLAEIHPGRSRGRVCELSAGYKYNRRASRTGGLRDLRITRMDTAGNGLPPFVASCARSGSRAPPGSAAMSHRGAVSPYLILSGLHIVEGYHVNGIGFRSGKTCAAVPAHTHMQVCICLPWPLSLNLIVASSPWVQ